MRGLERVNARRHRSLHLVARPVCMSDIRTNPDKADEHDAKGRGNRKPGSGPRHPSASPLDPPGAVFEPTANQRGGAPYRRIINRQVRVGSDRVEVGEAGFGVPFVVGRLFPWIGAYTASSLRDSAAPTSIGMITSARRECCCG